MSLRERSNDLGLLLLRLVPSAMLAGAHGWKELATFGESMGSFPDPLGVGSSFSLALTVFGELVCPIAVALGLFTRLAALPPLITMLVAAFVVHAADPWGKKEFPLLYAGFFLMIVLLGAGRWSLDHKRCASRGGTKSRT